MLSYKNFIAAVSDAEYLYWISENTGLGMRMNTNTYTVDFLNIPWRKTGITPVGNAVLAVRRELFYGITCGGDYFFIYDMVNNSIKTVKISMGKYLVHDYAFATLEEDKLYILPYYCEKLLVIDLSTDEVSLLELNMNSIKNVNGYYYAGIHEIITSKEVVCLDSHRKNVLFINLLEQKVESKKYPDEINKPLYICETNEGYYVLTYSGDVYFTDKNMDAAKLVFEHGSLGSEETLPFFSMCVKEGKIWLMPCFGEKIISVNLIDGSVCEFCDYPSDFLYQKEENMSNYTRAIEVGKRTFFAMHTGNYIFMVDENGEGKFIDTKWPSNLEFVEHYFLSEEYIEENMSTLSSFLEYVSVV